MDVIEASHFEAIKQFMIDRPWWEMKLFRYEGNWNVVLSNPTYIDIENMMIFVDKSLGEAFRKASMWVAYQKEVQKNERENNTREARRIENERADAQVASGNNQSQNVSD